MNIFAGLFLALLGRAFVRHGAAAGCGRAASSSRAASGSKEIQPLRYHRGDPRNNLSTTDEHC
jgi:hypothetical protein